MFPPKKILASFDARKEAEFHSDFPELIKVFTCFCLTPLSTRLLLLQAVEEGIVHGWGKIKMEGESKIEV